MHYCRNISIKQQHTLHPSIHNGICVAWNMMQNKRQPHERRSTRALADVCVPFSIDSRGCQTWAMSEARKSQTTRTRVCERVFQQQAGRARFGQTNLCKITTEKAAAKFINETDPAVIGEVCCLLIANSFRENRATNCPGTDRRRLPSVWKSVLWCEKWSETPIFFPPC